MDAESQPPLSYDQPNDERQQQVCLLPGTFQPQWKADRLTWCFSYGGKHSDQTVTFFPSLKANLVLTNPATKLKLHSHDLSLFGEDGYEVTAFHVAYDPNNAWAITGIRPNDPTFLEGLALPSNYLFVRHPLQASEQVIRASDRAFDERRVELLTHFSHVFRNLLWRDRARMLRN